MAKRKSAKSKVFVPGTEICARDVGKTRCKEKAKHYVMGQWVCNTHNPTGDDVCSHSLGIDRCAWCGADLREP